MKSSTELAALEDTYGNTYEYQPIPRMDPDALEAEVASMVDEVMSGLSTISSLPAVLMAGAAEAESNRQIQAELEEYKQAHADDPVWRDLYQFLNSTPSRQEPVASEEPRRPNFAVEASPEWRGRGQPPPPGGPRENTYLSRVPQFGPNVQRQYNADQAAIVAAGEPDQVAQAFVQQLPQQQQTSFMYDMVRAFVLQSVQNVNTRNILTFLLNNMDRVGEFIQTFLPKGPEGRQPPVDTGGPRADLPVPQQTATETQPRVVYPEDFTDDSHIKEPHKKPPETEDPGADFIQLLQRPLAPHCKRQTYYDVTLKKYRTRVVCIDQRGPRVYYDA